MRFERIIRHFDDAPLRGAEKLCDMLRDMLNAVLDPSTMSEYREAGMIDVHAVEQLLARVMRARREADVLLFKGSSDEDILRVYESFWEENKEEVVRLFERLARGWRERDEAREAAEYFG